MFVARGSPTAECARKTWRCSRSAHSGAASGLAAHRAICAPRYVALDKVFRTPSCPWNGCRGCFSPFRIRLCRAMAFAGGNAEIGPRAVSVAEAFFDL
jgi:hypothetical protein